MDLISRQAAIDALKKAYWDKDLQAAKDDPCVIDAMTDWAIRQVKALPSAERHGRWEELMEHRGAGGILGGKDICVGYACSECGEQSDIMTYYCPNCGAKMDEVEE